MKTFEHIHGDLDNYLICPDMPLCIKYRDVCSHGFPHYLKKVEVCGEGSMPPTGYCTLVSAQPSENVEELCIKIRYCVQCTDEHLEILWEKGYPFHFNEEGLLICNKFTEVQNNSVTQEVVNFPPDLPQPIFYMDVPSGGTFNSTIGGTNLHRYEYRYEYREEPDID